MHRLICRACKNSDPGRFVEDHKTAEIVCTSCGCVQSRINTSMGNVTFSEQLPVVEPSGSQQRQLIRTNIQMINRMCPGEYRDGKRNSMIKDYCEKLDLTSSVELRAKLFIQNHKGELLKIRPHENLIAACIVIACQSLKKYINVTDMEVTLTLTNVNTTIKAVCKIVGINFRSIILNSVPYLASMMSLPFKCEKKLRDLYIHASRKHPSMGAETRMALCCYKICTENSDASEDHGVTLEYIAALTNTSENSLRTYISGKTKCCLFNHKKRRRVGVEEDVVRKKRTI